MKGVVAYDSVHGSTKQVAEAIAEQIRSEGHEAQVIAAKEWSKGALNGDLLFIGSPTRGGKMTKEAKEQEKREKVTASLTRREVF